MLDGVLERLGLPPGRKDEDERKAEELGLEDGGAVLVSATEVSLGNAELADAAERWLRTREAKLGAALGPAGAALGERLSERRAAWPGVGAGDCAGVSRTAAEAAVLCADANWDGGFAGVDPLGGWWLMGGEGAAAGSGPEDGVGVWELGLEALGLRRERDAEAWAEEGMAMLSGREWEEVSLLTARMLSGLVAQEACGAPEDWGEGAEVESLCAWALAEGYLGGRWGFPVLRCWRGAWRYFGTVGAKGGDALFEGGGAERLAEEGLDGLQRVDERVLVIAGRMLVSDLAAAEFRPETAMEWRGMAGSPDERHLAALVAWAENSSLEVVERCLVRTLWLCGVDASAGMRLGARVLAGALERRKGP